MTPTFRCIQCGDELTAGKPRVLCGDYAWRCYDCASPRISPTHPHHEKDAGVAVRVALGVLLVALLIALARWVGP